MIPKMPQMIPIQLVCIEMIPKMPQMIPIQLVCVEMIPKMPQMIPFQLVCVEMIPKMPQMLDQFYSEGPFYALYSVVFMWRSISYRS